MTAVNIEYHFSYRKHLLLFCLDLAFEINVSKRGERAIWVSMQQKNEKQNHFRCSMSWAWNTKIDTFTDPDVPSPTKHSMTSSHYLMKTQVFIFWFQPLDISCSAQTRLIFYWNESLRVYFLKLANHYTGLCSVKGVFLRWMLQQLVFST